MRTLAVLALVVVAVAFVVPAYCAGIEEGTVKVPATVATEKISGTIDSVDIVTSMVTIKDKGKVVVDAVTLIKVDGKAAKLADLVKGMTVAAECEIALDKKLAKSIEAKSAVAVPAPVVKAPTTAPVAAPKPAAPAAAKPAAPTATKAPATK